MHFFLLLLFFNNKREHFFDNSAHFSPIRFIVMGRVLPIEEEEGKKNKRIRLSCDNPSFVDGIISERTSLGQTVLSSKVKTRE